MVFILNKLTQSLSTSASKREKARMRRKAREQRLSHSSHNQMDLQRDSARLSQSRGGVAHNNAHAPVGHMRQQLTMKPRGGDSRTKLPNRNNQIRRVRANDVMTIDRPLG